MISDKNQKEINDATGLTFQSAGIGSKVINVYIFIP